MARPPRDSSKQARPDAAGQLQDDRPPFLSWRKIYLLVLGALAVQVVLYTLLGWVMR